MNLTAKPPPQPKTKPKTRGKAKTKDVGKNEKKPEPEAHRVIKKVPSLKLDTKPEDIPLPPSPKKNARQALKGIDVNKPVLALAPQPAVGKKPSSKIGEIFGSYQTIKKLGAGSFGEVYLGVDLVSNRQVAIKLEPSTTSIPMLQVEAKMYEKLRGAAGIPVMKVCKSFLLRIVINPICLVVWHDS